MILKRSALKAPLGEITEINTDKCNVQTNTGSKPLIRISRRRRESTRRRRILAWRILTGRILTGRILTGRRRRRIVTRRRRRILTGRRRRRILTRRRRRVMAGRRRRAPGSYASRTARRITVFPSDDNVQEATVLTIADHRKICVHISAHGRDLVQIQHSSADQGVLDHILVHTTYHPPLSAVHFERNTSSHAAGSHTELLSPSYVVSGVPDPYWHSFQRSA